MAAGITPALKLIPSAVLYGYFAFMAIDSLKGSQLWDRVKLLGYDPRQRFRCALRRELASALQDLCLQFLVSYSILEQSNSKNIHRHYRASNPDTAMYSHGRYCHHVFVTVK